MALFLLRLSATSTAVRPALSPIVQSAPARRSIRTAVGDCANAAQWRAVCPCRFRATRRGSSGPSVSTGEDMLLLLVVVVVVVVVFGDSEGCSKGDFLSSEDEDEEEGLGCSRAESVAALASVSTADRQATMRAAMVMDGKGPKRVFEVFERKGRNRGGRGGGARE